MTYPTQLIVCFSQLLIISSGYRLNPVVRPIHYDIDIYLQSGFGALGQYSGFVSITLNVTEPTLDFQINQGNEITISNITLTAFNSTENLFNTSSLNNVTSILTISSNTTLVTNVEYTLDIHYQAFLSDDDFGFYRSSYLDSSNSLVWIAATQFQPSYARRAIPCFDEPSFKATFSITIVRPSEVHSLSNARKNYTISLDNDLERDVYETTPIMSTYLLAFVVSNFVGVTNIARNYTVWSREEVIASTNYVFNIGPELLANMEDFAGTQYDSLGISKLDQVAIPDFAAGAMENWGLVTYREMVFLFDENDSTARNKEQIATINSHEFAHKWFGNLVTCEWWSFTWLNEGLASYFEWFNTAEVETGFELDNQFVVRAFQSSMQADSSPSAPPLTSEVNSLAEIEAKFNVLTYSKGASLIRMVENFLGATNFRNGLRQYLSDNAYDTVVPDDLWNALQVNSTGLSLPANISTIMANWMDEPGHPVLNVVLNNSSVVISQSRFLIGSNATNTTVGSNWYVPISFTTSNTSNFTTTQPTLWLLPNQTLTLPNVALGSSDWIVLNLQSKGYYRVNYDLVLWGRLLNALSSPDHSNIHVLNRAQIIDDVFDLALANILPYNLLLDITRYLRNESEYYPWFSASQGFVFLRQRFSANQQLSSFIDRYILSDLLDDITQTLSFSVNTTNREIDIITQQFFLSWACTLGNQNCIEQSLQLFRNFSSFGQRINPNLRSVVYCTALRHSQSEWNDWHFLWNTSLQTNVVSEFNTIIAALGCTRNSSLLHYFLLQSIDPFSRIRSQDAPSIFASVLNGNPDGFNVAFEFFREFYEIIILRYGGINSIASLINGMASRLRTENEVNEFEQFFRNTSIALDGVDNIVAAAVQNSRTNVLWTTTHSTNINNWFVSHFSGTVSFLPSGFLLTIAISFLFSQYLL